MKNQRNDLIVLVIVLMAIIGIRTLSGIPAHGAAANEQAHGYVLTPLHIRFTIPNTHYVMSFGGSTEGCKLHFVVYKMKGAKVAEYVFEERFLPIAADKSYAATGNIAGIKPVDVWCENGTLVARSPHPRAE